MSIERVCDHCDAYMSYGATFPARIRVHAMGKRYRPVVSEMDLCESCFRALVPTLFPQLDAQRLAHVLAEMGLEPEPETGERPASEGA